MDQDQTVDKSTKYQKWLKIAKFILWTSAIALVVSMFYLFWSISKGDLPTFEQLENPQYDLAILFSFGYRCHGTL